jgi:hypothetical protein
LPIEGGSELPGARVTALISRRGSNEIAVALDP